MKVGVASIHLSKKMTKRDKRYLTLADTGSRDYLKISKLEAFFCLLSFHLCTEKYLNMPHYENYVIPDDCNDTTVI